MSFVILKKKKSAFWPLREQCKKWENMDWGQRGVKFDMTNPKILQRVFKKYWCATEMGIVVRGEFLKLTCLLAYMSSQDGAQMSLKNFSCTYQPDLISSMAATIKIPLSDIAISLFLHTPVSTHSDSLVFNVERAAGPDHKIMLTFHRVWEEQEKWVCDTYFVRHTK